MKNIKLDRIFFERIALLVIALCALSLIMVTFKSKETLTYDNGKITYTGYVVNHRLNGQGTLTYANGDTYKGEFKNGVFQGQGTFTSNEGWTYTGNFKSGQAEGQGKLTTQDGVIYKGTFKQGIYQG
ncbi:hypothetical protein [Streptococcus dentiloxodontae]